MQRKSVFYLVAALALLVVLLSAALVVSAEKGEPPGALPNSLSISGGALPPAGPIRISPPQNPEALINDGSFENGPPPGSAWTEVTNVGCEGIGPGLESRHSGRKAAGGGGHVRVDAHRVPGHDSAAERGDVLALQSHVG